MDAKNTVDDESKSIFTKSGTGIVESSDVSNDESQTIATKLAISDFSKLKGSDATKAEGASLVTKSAALLMRSDATKAEGASLVTKSGTLVSNGEIKVAESERVKKKKKGNKKTDMLRRKRNINGEDEIESKSRINLKQLRKLIHNISYLTSVNPDLLTADAVKELPDTERATESILDVTGQKSKDTVSKSDSTKESAASLKNFDSSSQSETKIPSSDSTKETGASSKNLDSSFQSETKIPSSDSKYSTSKLILVVIFGT